MASLVRYATYRRPVAGPLGLNWAQPDAPLSSGTHSTIRYARTGDLPINRSRPPHFSCQRHVTRWIGDVHELALDVCSTFDARRQRAKFSSTEFSFLPHSPPCPSITRICAGVITLYLAASARLHSIAIYLIQVSTTSSLRDDKTHRFLRWSVDSPLTHSLTQQTLRMPLPLRLLTRQLSRVALSFAQPRHLSPRRMTPTCKEHAPPSSRLSTAATGSRAAPKTTSNCSP